MEEEKYSSDGYHKGSEVFGKILQYTSLLAGTINGVSNQDYGVIIPTALVCGIGYCIEQSGFELAERKRFNKLEEELKKK